MFTGPLINQADAFVAAWLPGTQGRGIADVLVAGADGKTLRDFTGRLPFAWPADARSPVEKPLFAAGYGLDYRQSSNVPPVNEALGVVVSKLDQDSHYMVRGKVPAPWRLVQDGSTSSRPVDMGAQENAVQFSWNQPGAMAIEGAAVNLSKQLAQGYSLTVEWRIDQKAKGPLLLSFAGTAFDLSRMVAKAAEGEILQTRIPLRCFKAKGAKLTSVGSAIRIQAGKGLVASLRNIHIEAGGDSGSCP
jgi:beta-glucosidase